MRLELRDVRKRFGDVTAVDGVSLEILDGEFFALLGPSGCGKTTLLRMIAGIVSPDGGHVVLGNEDITARPVHARNTAMVFQNYALFPHLTVADNVAFGLVMRREAKAAIRARVDEALALVRLPGFGSRYPGQLSGGQQQRVALARALVVRPAVLLLDEPLSNLDARLRDEMRTEIREIQRQVGLTTILVTHDLHEAFAMSDRLAVMSAGRVEQIGTPAQIYAHPATRFVANFTGDANHFEGRVATIAGGVAVVTAANGLTLHVAAADAGLVTGQDISVMVRPERLRLGTAPLRLANAFPGVVERTTYLGALTNYHVRCCDTVRLLAQAQTLAGPAFQAGDTVTVEWEEHDCVVRA